MSVRHDALPMLARQVWATTNKGSMHMASGVTITVLGKASNTCWETGKRLGWK